MCHTGHRQKNYHSPLIGLPASTSPYLYTSILCTKEGSFFKSKSARVTSLLKTLQGLLMFLHDHKSWIISHFTFPTTLPSPLLRLPAASSHTWPPETEPLFPIGSVCPDGFPADTCVACYCTSLEVWLQNHLQERPSLAALSKTAPPPLSAWFYPL